MYLDEDELQDYDVDVDSHGWSWTRHGGWWETFEEARVGAARDLAATDAAALKRFLADVTSDYDVPDYIVGRLVRRIEELEATAYPDDAPKPAHAGRVEEQELVSAADVDVRLDAARHEARNETLRAVRLEQARTALDVAVTRLRTADRDLINAVNYADEAGFGARREALAALSRVAVRYRAAADHVVNVWNALERTRGGL